MQSKITKVAVERNKVKVLINKIAILRIKMEKWKTMEWLNLSHTSHMHYLYGATRVFFPTCVLSLFINIF